MKHFFLTIGLVSIFLLGSFLKIYEFDQFPAAFNPDEKIYLANAYVLSKTGTDITGLWQPWKIEPFHPMFAELPAVIYGLGFLLSDNPFIAGRIFPLIFGITLPTLMGLIAWRFFHSKKIALSVFFVASFNPWIWQQSRQSFDVLMPIWFYMTGILLLLTKNRWLKLIALPAFFLGFFQYQGLKVIYPLIIAPLSFQFLFYKQKIKILNLVIIAMLLGLFVFYFLIKLPSQGANDRISQNSILGAPYQEKIIQAVNTERRMSLDSEYKTLGSNKLTVRIYDLNSRITEALNITRIFVANEPSISGFSVWSHGLFYFIDLPLILIGVYYGFKKYPKITKLLLVWLAVGLLPSLINNTNSWYIFRISWTYMTFIYLTGLGFYALLQQGKLIKLALLILYALSIVNFAYQFFFRYPVYSANGVRLYQRVLASFVSRIPKDTSVLVLTDEPEGMRDSLIVYQQIPKEKLHLIKTQIDEHKTIEYENITLSDGCFDQEKFLANQQRVVLVDLDVGECPEDKKQSSLGTDVAKIPYHGIYSILDSGQQVRIYFDPICDRQNLSGYPNITRLDQFAMEKMTNTEFCQNWIQYIKPLD